MNRKLAGFITATAVASLIGVIYWPVHLADFVWDDQVCMHDAAWLRHGEVWKQFIAADFCGWKNYFRPLIVAMFAMELRIFDVTPGPMHLVSLWFHLINVVLVGLLAKTLSGANDSPIRSNTITCAAMTFYGLHPALIEPVAWISCRADLVLTFLVLVGLLANARIQRTALRAVAVAVCFFLAACAKESAVAFPGLLVLFDWIGMEPTHSERGFFEQVREILHRQWRVYAATLCAGVVYLAMRHGALGFILNDTTTIPLPLPARMQSVAYILVTYWRILVWPMLDLAPTHVVEPELFETFSAVSAATDLAALAIALAGFYGTFKRNPFGYAILAVNVALFPVLHILPVHFDPSLYHERYLMLGLALALALLPRMAASISLPAAKVRTASMGGAALVLLWLSVAVINIRVTVPLWSNSTRLWQWDLIKNPQSRIAKTNLHALYIDHEDHARAHELADQLLAEEKVCSLCLINVAALAMDDGDLKRAETALDAALTAMGNRTEAYVWQSFIMNKGRLRELQQDPVEAADDYKEAIKMDPLDPKSRMALALFLARQGKDAEARATMDETLPLFPPDMRAIRKREFERTLAAARKSTQPAAAQP